MNSAIASSNRGPPLNQRHNDLAATLTRLAVTHPTLAGESDQNTKCDERSAYYERSSGSQTAPAEPLQLLLHSLSRSESVQDYSYNATTSTRKQHR
jgi:hypothetical protein